MLSKKSEEILNMFETTIKYNVSGLTERYTLNELRLAFYELSPRYCNTPWLKLLEERIEDLELERKKSSANKQLQKSTVKHKLTRKQKSNPSDDLSKIDGSSLKPPTQTFIFRKIIKIINPESLLSSKHKQKITSNYKFHIIWNGAESKEIAVRKPSQMDSLFNLFISNKGNNYLIHQSEIKKYLETKQPPNRAIRDLNDALVDKLRRKFPKEKEHIPDLIIGYSKKKGGYITLIPIVDESILDTLDMDHILDKQGNEFFIGAQVMKRVGKKM